MKYRNVAWLHLRPEYHQTLLDHELSFLVYENQIVIACGIVLKEWCWINRVPGLVRLVVASVGRDLQAACQKNRRCHSLNRAPPVFVTVDECAPSQYWVLAMNAISLPESMFG